MVVLAGRAVSYKRGTPVQLSTDAPPLSFVAQLGTDLSHRTCLSISFRKSTPLQNRQLIVHCYYLKYQVLVFWGEST